MVNDYINLLLCNIKVIQKLQNQTKKKHIHFQVYMIFSCKIT